MTTNTEAAPGQTDSVLDTLYNQDRVVITASLRLTNSRFLQPTGFPDIDACLYRDQEGRRWCLVESEQSMSNRLESVCMKSPGVWVDDLKGLPLIVVRNKAGDLLATNLTEPHRLASSYILDGKPANSGKNLREIFAEKLELRSNGDFWPLDKRAALEQLVFALDPAALLHGFQFVQWKFVGLRQTRLIHARLEAELADEPEVHYGMVKWDAIEPDSTREERANKGQSIAAKSRIIPKNITATFDIDLLGLKTLSVGEDRKKFLLGLALWKIGAFLANKPAFDPRSRSTGPSLRLRADCYLTFKGKGSLSWQGNSGCGTTCVAALMAAKPADLGQADGPRFKQDAERNDNGKKTEMSGVTFRELVKEILSTGEQEEKRKSISDGTVVEVRYEPKRKQEKGSSGNATVPDRSAVSAEGH